MSVPGFLGPLSTLPAVKHKTWQWKVVTIAHHVYERKDSDFTKKEITDLVGGDGQWYAQLLGRKRPEAAFLLRHEGSSMWDRNVKYSISLQLNESDFEAR